MNLSVFLPHWTKRVALGSGGRDPLGLSRVAQALTRELMSGIITMTWSARYYSIYCWILQHIEETEAPESYAEFTRSFRRREAAFAVATLRDQSRRPGVAPVGVKRLKRHIDKNWGETINLDLRLLNNDLGGYGQNYAGSMHELGLWSREKGGFEHITGERADLLALAVGDSLRNTPYVRQKLWTKAEVSTDALDASASAMSLDALRQPSHEFERDTLVRLLFALGDEGCSQADVRRRHTLTWILWIIQRYAEAELPCSARPRWLAQRLLYAPLYFGVITGHEEHTVEIEPPAPLAYVAVHWRVFCAQQYLTLAHEFALSALLDVSAKSDNGLTLDEAVELLVSDKFQAAIDVRVDNKGTTPSELLTALELDEVPSAHDSATSLARRPIHHPLSEDRLCRGPSAPEAKLAEALMLLASLYARWRALPSNAAIDWLRRDAASDPWVGNCLAWIDAWFDENYGWEQAARTLLRHLVERHQDVLWEKGDIRRCWLNHEEGRVRHVRDLRPAMRGSRFRNAVWMLRDLGLVRDGDEFEMLDEEAEYESQDEPEDEHEYEHDQDEDQEGDGLRLTELGEALLAELEEGW